MEMIFNSFIGIFIAAYMFMSLALDKKSISGDVFGAGGFPIVLAVLGFIVLALIVKDCLKNKTQVHIPMFDIKSVDGKMLAVNVVVLTGYLMLMDVLGFILSTFIFTFASTRAMGYKKTSSLVLFSVVLTTAIVLVFGKLFFVPLPRGLEIFRELSYFIY